MFYQFLSKIGVVSVDSIANQRQRAPFLVLLAGDRRP